MAIASRISQAYAASAEVGKNVERKVRETLVPFCAENGFVFEGRLKSLESVAEKIESGRYARWSEVDDLYACTIAVPVLHDEDVVREFLGDVFKVIDARMRGGSKKPADAFRFDSTRIVASLKPPEGIGIDEPMYAYRFEVQLKSMFDFAWSKTTHALTYKSNLVDWKRHRLAAHLKAAAEQIDFLLAGFENAADLVHASKWPEIDDKVRIREFFVDRVKEGLIPSEATPQDWSRFADNLYQAVRAFDQKPRAGGWEHKLSRLEEALTIIDEYLRKLTPESFPRSLSLFQLMMGVIGASTGFTGKRRDYYLPLASELRDLFPTARRPSEEFSFD